MCVTYGDVMAPSGFRRLTTAEGMAANINPSGKPTYLWYKRGKKPSAFITQLSVSEGTPLPGFKNVDGDLNVGSKLPPLFLATKTDDTKDAILDLFVGNARKDDFEREVEIIREKAADSITIWAKKGAYIPVEEGKSRCIACGC